MVTIDPSKIAAWIVGIGVFSLILREIHTGGLPSEVMLIEFSIPFKAIIVVSILFFIVAGVFHQVNDISRKVR